MCGYNFGYYGSPSRGSALASAATAAISSSVRLIPRLAAMIRSFRRNSGVTRKLTTSVFSDARAWRDSALVSTMPPVSTKAFLLPDMHEALLSYFHASLHSFLYESKQPCYFPSPSAVGLDLLDHPTGGKGTGISNSSMNDGVGDRAVFRKSGNCLNSYQGAAGRLGDHEGVSLSLLLAEIECAAHRP